MTKKVLFLSIALSSILFGCQKDSDNDDEIAELKKRLEAIEKGKTVTAITFEGANMVITYSTGEKITTPIPAGVKGETGPAGPIGPAGPTGATGVGIASITYDETTGILKIKLTNGNESSFQVVTGTDGSLSAVLLSDTKGKQLIASLYAGAAPYLEMTYDPTTFEAATAKSSDIVDGQVRKSMEVSKSYTAGKLTSATVKRFALRKDIAYTYNYFQSIDGDQVTYATYKGSFFSETGTDGLYTLYVYLTSGGGGSSIYRKYTNVVKLATPLPAYSDYVYSETVVYNINAQIYVPGSTDNWYKTYGRYDKTGVTNPGDLVSSDTYALETNTDGLVTKVTRTGEQRYISLAYNSLKKLSQAVEYINSSVARTMNYEYNAANQLVSVKQVEGGTTTEMMKAEYDANGNPVKIYAYQSELYSYGWSEFDPWENPVNPYGPHVVRPKGLYLYATLEYTSYKNFFGNSIGSVFPGLGAFSPVNAPKKVAYANSAAFGSIEYKDFNEFGYPQTIVTNGASTTDGGGSIRIELTASYTKKTN
ncbi:collagen-like triple helix repeat-containing protein [Paraflavitalea pollutisoli]|uniref:collagen-like triple helix repeat-containing protein n=1 Tax=Paraflavitalea pollutisoli TaxID=3034143 RepID=UPI0023ECB297|nr:collagen-like protein [Paraflavitalea sp. H1-2-19X]